MRWWVEGSQDQSTEMRRIEYVSGHDHWVSRLRRGIGCVCVSICGNDGFESCWMAVLIKDEACWKAGGILVDSWSVVVRLIG
jgi:hypothetical protein